MLNNQKVSIIKRMSKAEDIAIDFMTKNTEITEALLEIGEEVVDQEIETDPENTKENALDQKANNEEDPLAEVTAAIGIQKEMKEVLCIIVRNTISGILNTKTKVMIIMLLLNELPIKVLWIVGVQVLLLGSFGINYTKKLRFFKRKQIMMISRKFQMMKSSDLDLQKPTIPRLK